MVIRPIDGFAPSSAPAAEGVAVSPPANAAGGNDGAVAPHDVHEVVGRANTALQQMTQAVEFEVDKSTQSTVVRLVDTQDHQVLRQIPSEEMLEIAHALERMQAALVREKA